MRKFSLREVLFHHCRYGSSRRKLTKLFYNVPSFQLLDSFCGLDGYSGVGGVVYSSTGTGLGCFSEQVTKSFLLAAMGADQHTMNQEL